MIHASFAKLLKPFNIFKPPQYFTPAPAKPKPVPTLSSPFSTAPITPALNYTPYRAPANMSIAPPPAPNMTSAITGKPAYAPPPPIAPVRPIAPVAQTQGAVPPPPIAPVQGGNITTPSGAVVNPATGGLVSAPPAQPGASASVAPPASPAPVPPAPVIPQSYYDAIKAAEDVYKGALPITPEESAATEELEKLQSSFRQGYLGASQRPIPMEFITGQQKAIEARSLALAEPISAKLARLQAKRQASIEASKFALERADKRLEAERGIHKPVSVSPGENLVDPVTGKTIASGGSVSDKQALDTFFNITQTYPDAQVSWNPALSPQQNLDAARKAAEASPSFQAKQTVYAINPLTGEPQIVSKRPGGIGAPEPRGGLTTQNLAPELKAALNNVSGIQFFDQSKVTSAQLPYLQRAAQQMGVPLLTKEDANKIQDAFSSFKSADALIGQIVNLSGKVLKASNNPGDMTAQAARLKAIEIAPYLSRDEEAKQFISARKSVLSLLTRAAGEKGVLTNVDIERIAQAMPSYGDNKTLAAQKAANFSSVIQSVFSGAVAAYVGSGSFGGGAPSGGGGTNDPMGLF